MLTVILISTHKSNKIRYLSRNASFPIEESQLPHRRISASPSKNPCAATDFKLFHFLYFQLWYVHRPPEDEHFRNRAYSSSDVHDTILPESMKLQVGVSSNGDVDVGEINLSEMDPEDIRVRIAPFSKGNTPIYTIRNKNLDLSKCIYTLRLKINTPTS